MSATDANHNAFRRTVLRGVTLLGAALGFLLILFIWRAESRMEVISLHHWLDAEVNQYLRDYAKDPESARTPNPYEFDTYSDDVDLPGWLHSYRRPGFYEHVLGSEDKHFRVIEHPSGAGLLYVVFKNDADDYLDQYETRLHWMSVGMALVTWLLTSLGALLLIGRLTQPMRSVLSKITQMSPGKPDFAVDSPYDELRRIESALLSSKQEIRRYFRREQEFSRFASHEIRTPLMVMRGSVDILSALPLEEPAAHRAVARIDDACHEMVLLTELFLILGRDEIETRHFQSVSLEALIGEMVERLETDGRRIDVTVNAAQTVYVPPVLMKALLRNLTRNAIIHGSGDIHLNLSEDTLSVRNAMAETDTTSQGFGFGLVIVERICERLGWRFTVFREAGEFHAQVDFASSGSASELDQAYQD